MKSKIVTKNSEHKDFLRKEISKILKKRKIDKIAIIDDLIEEWDPKFPFENVSVMRIPEKVNPYDYIEMLQENSMLIDGDSIFLFMLQGVAFFEIIRKKPIKEDRVITTEDLKEEIAKIQKRIGTNK